MVLSPECRVVVRGRISLGRRLACAAAHVCGRLVCTAVVSSQSSHQVVMLRLVAFRGHARRGIKDEYSLGAARCRRAVGPAGHRRGLLPWVYGVVALSGRVDARRLSQQCRLIAKRRAVGGRSDLRGDHMVVACKGEAVRVLGAAVRQRKSNYAFKPTPDRSLRQNRSCGRRGLMRR